PVFTGVDDDGARVLTRRADGYELRVVARRRRVDDAIRTAADLVLKGRPESDFRDLHVIPGRGGFAEAVGPCVDDDRALRAAGSGRGDLFIRTHGDDHRCHEADGERARPTYA